MTGRFLAGGLLALAAAGTPAGARTAIDISDASGSGGIAASPYLQCVPYARQVSGIRIYGDAHTWWGQAEGRYAKGSEPRVGAVMAFRPNGNSRLGHVAAVSRILDSRTVLIKHANWSRRGEIEDNVRAIDVSPDNDWSQVRVWYGPNQTLGNRHWPLYGFIYGDKPGKRGKDKVRAARSSDPIGDIIAGRLR